MIKREADTQASSQSIVLADDDNFVLEAVGELLRAQGYTVHCANDGLEALRLIRQERPRYVILDIMLPKLDGSRVCWLMRQDPVLRDTPVIAFSSISPQAFREFPELSADAYVAKAAIPLAFQNVLKAMAYVDARSEEDLAEGLFGYEGVRPRHLVEELLRERRHYTNVMRALGGGVLELDKAGHILMATPEACEVLGQREGRIIGEALASFCATADRKVVQDHMAAILKATAPARRQAVVRFGRREYPLRFCAIVEEGECTGVLVILESHGTRDGGPSGAGRKGGGKT